MEKENPRLTHSRTIRGKKNPQDTGKSQLIEGMPLGKTLTLGLDFPLLTDPLRPKRLVKTTTLKLSFLLRRGLGVQFFYPRTDILSLSRALGNRGNLGEPLGRRISVNICYSWAGSTLNPFFLLFWVELRRHF